MMGDMRQRTTPGKEPGCVENEMISAAAVGDGLPALTVCRYPPSSQNGCDRRVKKNFEQK